MNPLIPTIDSKGRSVFEASTPVKTSRTLPNRINTEVEAKVKASRDAWAEGSSNSPPLSDRPSLPPLEKLISKDPTRLSTALKIASTLVGKTCISKKQSKEQISKKKSKEQIDVEIRRCTGEYNQTIFLVCIPAKDQIIGRVQLSKVTKSAAIGLELDIPPGYGPTDNPWNPTPSKIHVNHIVVDDSFSGVGMALFQVGIEYSLQCGYEGRMDVNSTQKESTFFFECDMLSANRGRTFTDKYDSEGLPTGDVLSSPRHLANDIQLIKALKAFTKDPITPTHLGVEGPMYLPEKKIEVWMKRIANSPILFPLKADEKVSAKDIKV